MKNKIVAIVVGCGLSLVAQAVEITSKNTVGTLISGTVWDGGVAPGVNDVAVWSTSGNTSSGNALGGDASWQGIRVAVAINKDITVNASGAETLTLGSAGIDMSAVPTDPTKRTFIINPKVDLGSAQTWNVAESSTGPAVNPRFLTVAGVISGGSGSKLTKSGTGTLTLEGANTFSGGVNLDQGVLLVNTPTALGSGTLRISNGTTIGALANQAKTLANQVVVNGNFTMGQTTKKALTLSGTMDLGGSTRTITMGNTFGNLISGNISNGGLIKDGAYSLTLSGANDYAAGTTVSMGALIGGADNAFGIGDITVASGATLVLTNGVSNNYIHDLAKLVLGGSSALSLDFTGADTVAGLSLNGGTTWLSAGTYSAAALSGQGGGTYTGTGMITVIPEPATIGMLGLGALITVMIRRMRNS
jgi:autotransporter-associated beta strand protein